MKFKNKKETSIVPSIYIIVVAVFITNTFASIELKYDDVPFNYNSLIPGAVALLIGMYVFVVGRAFEFDSDGEALIFKSSGLLISKFFLYRDQRTEVPKSKLQAYRVENYLLYKRLHIFITSRNKKGFRHYKYNITLLSGTKTRAMKISLEKVLDKNKAKV